MELDPYVAALRQDLITAAAAGGEEISRAAELLTGALGASARLYLIEALADAAAEITSRLDTASVEVRMRGRDADLVVTEVPETPPVPPAPPVPPNAPAPPGDGADLARVTLRIPESLKEQVDRAAAAEGISVNAWLARAVASAIAGAAPGGTPPYGTPPYGGTTVRRGGRITGFAQA